MSDVIIQFDDRPGNADAAQISAKGGVLKKQFRNVPIASARVPVASLEGLAQNPRVKYISPDRPNQALLDRAAPAVNAPIAWQSGLDGAGIGVAVVDSGIIDDDDLRGAAGSRIVYAEDFTGLGKTIDKYGHGTHIAGIIGSMASDSAGMFKGVAPNVRLISLRALNASGQGTDSSVIAAIDAAIALKDRYNIRVLNLSVGRPIFESYQLDPLCQAVERAWQADIVVVVAAGNRGRDDSQHTGGYGTIASPGNDPYVITVGAMKSNGTPTRSDDLIASYSSKGPTLIDHIAKPDLVAPGNLIVSNLRRDMALYGLYPDNQVPLNYYKKAASSTSSSIYYRLSGTSMAAAVVSGVSAVLLQHNPQFTPDQVKARLMKTAGKAFPATSIAVDPATGKSYTSHYDLFTVGPDTSMSRQRLPAPIHRRFPSAPSRRRRRTTARMAMCTSYPTRPPSGIHRPCGEPPPSGAPARCGALPLFGALTRIVRRRSRLQSGANSKSDAQPRRWECVAVRLVRRLGYCYERREGAPGRNTRGTIGESQA